MVYKMEIYVDGGCRRNGHQKATGAAAAAFKYRNGGHRAFTRLLPPTPPPTSQRAELTAIILSLEQALVRKTKLRNNPRLRVMVYSDSRYAVGCMKEWIYKWANNGWITSQGKEVANRDLIQRASDLDDKVKEFGTVSYSYIPREKNGVADGLCREMLD